MTLSKEVQAYLPSYAPASEYVSIQYDKVTAIIYSFLYIKADGSITPEAGYAPENLIAYAHARNVKVILAIQDYSTADSDTMLTNPNARATAINNIFNEVVNKGYDGVDTDIEKMSFTASNKTNFTAFQQELSGKFWGSNPNYRLSIAIGAYWPNTDIVFDVAVLQNYCNFIMIMGYDWTGSWSTSAASNSPYLLDNGTGNYDTIKHYETLMDKRKFLLVVPYYGREFATVSNTRMSSINGSVTEIIYDQFIDNVAGYARNYDSIWQTPWYTRQVNGQWYQGHYDDVQSLGQKYDLIISEGLGGIGIWEISQGTNRQELWDIIQTKFLLTTRYQTSITISVLGEPAGYSADALISEFKSFVEANTQFNLNITVNKYPSLADDEICWQPYSNCINRYWPSTSCLHSDTIQKLSSNTQCNMILFDTKGKDVCFGGACECWDSINGVPVIMIPLGAWPLLDNSPSCVNGICAWNRALTQTLVHEWMHVIDYILAINGYSIFSSPDTCREYGYNEINDPGWANCLKYLLSMLTLPMYEAVQAWGTVPIEYGTLAISSVPQGANVYVDGNNKGLTDIYIDPVITGYHKILIAKQGYDTIIDQNVLVTANQTTYRGYTLKTTPASIKDFILPGAIVTAIILIANNKK